jgi:hypothetical protein
VRIKGLESIEGLDNGMNQAVSEGELAQQARAELYRRQTSSPSDTDKKQPPPAKKAKRGKRRAKRGRVKPGAGRGLQRPEDSPQSK